MVLEWEGNFARPLLSKFADIMNKNCFYEHNLVLFPFHTLEQDRGGEGKKKYLEKVERSTLKKITVFCYADQICMPIVAIKINDEK